MEEVPGAPRPAKARKFQSSRLGLPVDQRLGSGLYALQRLLEEQRTKHGTAAASSRQGEASVSGRQSDDQRNEGQEFRPNNESSDSSELIDSRPILEFEQDHESSGDVPEEAAGQGNSAREGSDGYGGDDEESSAANDASASQVGREDAMGSDESHEDHSRPAVPREDESEDEDGDGHHDGGGQDREEESHITDPVQLAELLLLIYATHNTTVQTMEDVVRLFRRLIQGILVHGGAAWSAPLPSFQTMKRKAKQASPPIMIDYEFTNKGNGQAVSEEKQLSVPLHIVADRDSFGLVYTFAYVQLSDLIQFHRQQHPNHEDQVILAFDNVPVNKSSGESFDIASVQFPSCHRVYPYRVFHGVKGVKLEQFRNLRLIMRELLDLGVSVKHIIADLPKRAALMGLRQHGGYYACSNCLVPGEYSPTAGTMYYPVDRAWPPRTAHQMQEITDQREFPALAQNADKHREVLLGMRDRTPLFDLPDFDVIQQIPIDEMHNIFLGVVRKLMHRTFQTGESSRGQKEPRMALAKFNSWYGRCKVPTEQTRKTREFSSFWKASEYRCLILMHFPVMLITLQSHPSSRKKILMDIWASLMFVVLYVHGEVRDNLVPVVRQAMDVFKHSYTDYFGPSSLNLNCHLFSHLVDVHEELGDLNRVSAIASESLYQTFLKCFKAGTRTVSAQAMSNVYLKYQLTHACQRQLRHTTEENFRTQDNYIFTEQYRVYRVITVNETTLLCHEVIGNPFVYRSSNGTRLSFTDFGTFKGPFSENDCAVNIPVDCLRGKALINKHYCVCVPKATLLGGYY